MAIKQLSVFAENKPGALVEITDVISESGIDMRALSVADTGDFGILRIIVSDTEKAEKILTEKGFVTKVTPVLAVKISDEPGALTKAIKLLYKESINVEYLYAFIASSKKNAYVVLRVADNEVAERILTENGFGTVTEEDIQNL